MKQTIYSKKILYFKNELMKKVLLVDIRYYQRAINKDMMGGFGTGSQFSKNGRKDFIATVPKNIVLGKI